MSRRRRAVRVVGAVLIGGLAAATVAAALAGCGRGGSTSTGYTEADAERLAKLAPVTPGWPAWPEKPDAKRHAAQTPEEAAAKDPIYAKYRRKTAHVAREGGSGNHWQDDDKLANLSVSVLESDADAHVDFLASNELSRGYGDMYGFVDKAESVAGLGDEAWRLWAHGNGAQVTYQWRRDNLVVEAHVHCFGTCPQDVDSATRAWAEAIDAEAQASHPAPDSSR